MSKLNFLWIIFFVTFFSCTKDADLNQNTIDKPRRKVDGNGPHNLLGFGCNSTKGHLDPLNHTESQVIDVERLIVEQPSMYYVYDPNVTFSELIAGSTATDYSLNIKEKYDKSFVCVEPFTSGVNLDMGIDRTVNKKNSYASFFSKISLRHMLIYKRYDILMNYLTSDFINAVNTLPASEIINIYGTHVYTDITIGGKLEVTYRSFAGTTLQKETVTAGVKSSVEKVFQLTSTTTVEQSLKTENKNVSCKYVTFGGAAGSFSLSGELTETTPDMGGIYNSWSSTVTLSNSVIVDVANESLIPIYKFVSDPVKAEQIRVATEQYINQNKITLVDGTIKGPFSLGSSYDKIISLDYNGDGTKDILLYRSGGGIVCLNYGLKNGTFNNCFMSSNGLSGYDFNSTADQVIALDFNGDKKDDLMCYRSGMGAVYLMKSNGDGTFTTILASSNGLGGYDFNSMYDKAIALDYNGDQKVDLMFYRPGMKAVYLLRGNGNGTFTTVFTSSNGLAGFNFDQTKDLAISLDYNGDGKDDVMCYRPSNKVVYIQKSNGNGTFTTVYLSTNGIGGFNFDQISDKAIALDYNNDGYDDLMCYRPGGSACYLLKSNGNATFATVYYGEGIAGFDLHDIRDRIISLDFDNNGTSDIIMYRPGMSCVFSAKSKADGTYEFVYRE